MALGLVWAGLLLDQRQPGSTKISQGYFNVSHRILTNELPYGIAETRTVSFFLKTSKVKKVINPDNVLKVLKSDSIEKRITVKKPMLLDGITTEPK